MPLRRTPELTGIRPGDPEIVGCSFERARAPGACSPAGRLHQAGAGAPVWTDSGDSRTLAVEGRWERLREEGAREVVNR
jgi:hypothetical protein